MLSDILITLAGEMVSLADAVSGVVSSLYAAGMPRLPDAGSVGAGAIAAAAAAAAGTAAAAPAGGGPDTPGPSPGVPTYIPGLSALPAPGQTVYFPGVGTATVTKSDVYEGPPKRDAQGGIIPTVETKQIVIETDRGTFGIHTSIEQW